MSSTGAVESRLACDGKRYLCRTGKQADHSIAKTYDGREQSICVKCSQPFMMQARPGHFLRSEFNNKIYITGPELESFTNGTSVLLFTARLIDDRDHPEVYIEGFTSDSDTWSTGGTDSS